MSEILNEIKKFDNNEPKYKNIVFSGGGVKGIAHIGIVFTLQKSGLLDVSKLDKIVGTSAGSMFAALLAFGFSVTEIWNFVYKLDFGKIVNVNFINLFQNNGLDNGDTIVNIFEQFLTQI